MRSGERGVALLEVLAAIAILAAAGLSFVTFVAEGIRAAASDRARERELVDEERLITAYALLKRTDLDRRLGTRAVGPYLVTVQRSELTLYRVAIGRNEAAPVEDLVTVLYRGEIKSGP